MELDLAVLETEMKKKTANNNNKIVRFWVEIQTSLDIYNKSKDKSSTTQTSDYSTS